MQFTFVLLAAFVSAATAAPIKRQNTCPLQNFSGLTVTASADSSYHTRWDISTVSAGLIQQDDLAWYIRGSPNGNEVFTAGAGSAPNLFTFQRKGAQYVGVSGSTLLAASSPATFKVTCSACDELAKTNGMAADDCSFELTNGTNGIGQCMNYESANTVVQLQDCQDGAPGQKFALFVA